MVAKYQRITVDGPFETVPGQDAKQARATLEAADDVRHLVLTIPGPRHPARGNSSEDAWQDAMGFLTLLELTRWNVADLPAGLEARVTLHLLEDVSPEEWKGVGVEAFVQHRLFEYTISRTATGWQATAVPELEAIREVIRTDPSNVVPVFTVRCHKCNLPIYVLHDGSRRAQPFPHDAFVTTCPNQPCRHRGRYSRGEVFRT